MTLRTGWTGGIVVVIAAVALIAPLLASGGEGAASPDTDGDSEPFQLAHVAGTASAEAVGPIEGPRPVQAVGAAALLDGIEGTPPVACELVVRSLGNRWGASSVDPRIHPPLAGTPPERAVARWAWTGRPVAAEADALLAGLGSDDACVQRVAARLLGVMDDPGLVPRIVELTRTGSGSRRLAAIASLAHVSDDRASDALDALLDDGDPEVRRAAAWALAEAGDEDAVVVLTAALRDDDPLLRENAAWALGRIESAEALGSLQAALRDPTVGVRVNAAWALGQIEDAAAIPSLAAVVGGDAEDEVRRTAAWALGRIER